MEQKKVHTVVMYPRPHADPIVALFLLRTFGEQFFSGVKEAKLDFWNMVPKGKTPEQWEQEGYLLLDLGGGKFDHHHSQHIKNTKICAAVLVAKYLEIDQKPELRKLLEYARRDDLEGRGIVSKDPIDRAFGFPAIIMNLNRDYPEHPEYVVEMVLRIINAHYNEEHRRQVLMPQEFEQLKKDGKAQGFVINAARPVKVVMIESDSPTLVGYLRAVSSVQADIVVQRRSSGHTNIITRQVYPRLDLAKTVARLRQTEINSHDASLEWERPGRMPESPAWYYDTAANTLQNGGAAEENITPTGLSLAQIKEILGATIPAGVTLKETQRK